MPLELGNVLSFEREPWDDPEIRVEALESIYLITVQEAGLRAFWFVNGPRILQFGYEDEEDPKVMEAYERVGSLKLLKLYRSSEIASSESSGNSLPIKVKNGKGGSAKSGMPLHGSSSPFINQGSVQGVTTEA
ncbi:hypothetical protein Peur_025595 [Populus x canadensis]